MEVRLGGAKWLPLQGKSCSFQSEAEASILPKEPDLGVLHESPPPPGHAEIFRLSSIRGGLHQAQEAQPLSAPAGLGSPRDTEMRTIT